MAAASASPRRRAGRSTTRPNSAKVIAALEAIQSAFNASAPGGRKVSFADLVVLGGSVAVEQAAKAAGVDIEVPFTPGRMDATQEETEIESFAWLEPRADGFRNYLRNPIMSAEEHLVDRAQLLSLSAPEMTVLVGGLRALNVGSPEHGVLTAQPGTLTNDFFVNLLDMGTKWTGVEGSEGVFEGRDRKSGALKWTATRVDLIFGSHSQLRALAEVYARQRCKGEVRPRLRGRLDQGDEPRSVRPALTSVNGLAPQRPASLTEAGRLLSAVSAI